MVYDPIHKFNFIILLNYNFQTYCYLYFFNYFINLKLPYALDFSYNKRYHNVFQIKPFLRLCINKTTKFSQFTLYMLNLSDCAP